MTSSRSRETADERPSTEQVDAAMRALRAFVGVAAASIASVDDVVTVPQLRVLVMIATRGPLNVAAVAAGLDVNASNASRSCDRLITAGLLDRRESETDRRNVVLTLTPGGRRLIDTVTKHRRTAIRRVLRKMSPADRDALTKALEKFATAVGEPVSDDISLMLDPQRP